MPWPGNSLVMHSTVMGEKSSMMPPFEVTTFTIMFSETPWCKPLNTQFPIIKDEHGLSWVRFRGK